MAVVALPQFEVLVIMAGIVVLAAAIIAVATRGRLGSNDYQHRARRHNIALPPGPCALGCSSNMERDASRRLKLAMAAKNDIAGWTSQLRDRKPSSLRR